MLVKLRCLENFSESIYNHVTHLHADRKFCFLGKILNCINGWESLWKLFSQTFYDVIQRWLINYLLSWCLPCAVPSAQLSRQRLIGKFWIWPLPILEHQIRKFWRTRFGISWLDLFLQFHRSQLQLLHHHQQLQHQPQHQHLFQLQFLCPCQHQFQCQLQCQPQFQHQLQHPLQHPLQLLFQSLHFPKFNWFFQMVSQFIFRSRFHNHQHPHQHLLQFPHLLQFQLLFRFLYQHQLLLQFQPLLH